LFANDLERNFLLPNLFLISQNNVFGHIHLVELFGIQGGISIWQRH